MRALYDDLVRQADATVSGGGQSLEDYIPTIQLPITADKCKNHGTCGNFARKANYGQCAACKPQKKKSTKRRATGDGAPPRMHCAL